MRIPSRIRALGYIEHDVTLRVRKMSSLNSVRQAYGVDDREVASKLNVADVHFCTQYI